MPFAALLPRLLLRVNHARLFRRRVRLWGSVVRARSADRLLALWLFRLGLMGRAEVAALRRVVPRGGRAVDVGANQGALTLLLARLVGPEGEVVALEPDPPLFETLAENCRENGAANVELHRAAASDTAGQSVLHRNALNAGDNRLDSVPGPGAGVLVDLVRLDDVLRERPVDVVKIDVQGHEPRVLQGMRGVLASHHRPVVLLEYHPDVLREAGHEPRRLLDLLRAAGYEIHALDAEGGERPLDEEELARLSGAFGYVDLLARPQAAGGGKEAPG